jgi:hypothetical protein
MLINGFIIMTTLLFIKSLLTSLCQREEITPSLVKRGKGRFSDLYKFNLKIRNKCILIKDWLVSLKGCEVSLQTLFITSPSVLCRHPDLGGLTWT